MEQWKRIPEFPDYAISNMGRVRNDETGHVMALLMNQRGIINVGFTKNRILYKRSVTVLVAEAFLPKINNRAFDTPINLDGDRSNNYITNLMWRPRWFAVKYHQQFKSSERGFTVPVQEIHSGEKFKCSWDAAIKYGLLDLEILNSTINRTFVWPTYQEFRVIGR